MEGEPWVLLGIPSVPGLALVESAGQVLLLVRIPSCLQVRGLALVAAAGRVLVLLGIRPCLQVGELALVAAAGPVLILLWCHLRKAGTCLCWVGQFSMALEGSWAG